MEIVTAIVLLAVAAAIGAAWLFSSKKKDAGIVAGVACVGLIGLAFVVNGGSLGALSSGGTINLGGAEDVDISAQAVKFYDTVSVSTKVYGSNSYTAASGTVKFYESGVDPTSSNSNPLDTITVTSGVGNTTQGKLKSATPYGIVLDGSSTYYDMWYNGQESNTLPYVETSDATISKTTIEFNEILTVATIDDPLNEAATDGSVNGQTAAEITTSGGSKEIQVGSTGSSADDNILYYNKTNGDGQFYIDLDLGVSGANKVAKDVVIAFSNDRSNPFEGNEFSSVTLQQRTGTNFGLPSDITNYVNEMGVIPIDDLMEGGTTGEYRMTFNVDESLLTAGGDIFYINIDDLNAYQGQDLLRGTKATASDTVTLAVVA